MNPATRWIAPRPQYYEQNAPTGSILDLPKFDLRWCQIRDWPWETHSGPLLQWEQLPKPMIPAFPVITDHPLRLTPGTLDDDGRLLGCWRDLLARDQLNLYTSGGDKAGNETLLITAYDALYQVWRPLMWAPEPPEEPPEVYDYYQYGVTPPVTPGLVAAEEAFTQDTELVSYNEVIRHSSPQGLRGGRAPAKTCHNKKVKQKCNSVVTFNIRNKWNHIDRGRRYTLTNSVRSINNLQHLPKIGLSSNKMDSRPEAELQQRLHEESESSQKHKTHLEREMLATPKRKRNAASRVGRAPTGPSSVSYNAPLFAPSPLYPAQTALSSFNDDFLENTQEGHDFAGIGQVFTSSSNSAATPHQQATTAAQALPPITQYLAHGSPTSRDSQTNTSYPRRLNVHDYLSSATGPPSPKSSKENVDAMGLSESIITGYEPLINPRVDTPPIGAQGSSSPNSDDDGNVRAASDENTVAALSSRQVPTLTSPVTRPKSRMDPPQNFFEEAVLRLIDAATLPGTAASPPTPPRPTTFSPISQGPASPRPRPTKRAKRGETAGDEDPFEDFDSGSEADDEGDADFGAGPGAASPSPSVEEITSRSPTPTDDEGDTMTGQKRSRTKSRPSKLSAAPSCKTGGGAEKESDMSVSEDKVKVRRSNGMGDWPTASQAVQTAADHTQTIVKVDDTNESGAMVVRGRHVDAAAAAGTTRQRIDKTDRDGVGWVLLAEMVAGQRKVSWKWE
ncbi:MAG: hypothetical protein Q9207_000908 [Kuettlingeria erythrocarpa]